MSPAANTSSWPVARSIASTRTKPAESSVSPESASHDAGAASVAHSTSSAGTRSSPNSTRSASTRVTRWPAWTAMPRDARIAAKRARNAGGNAGRMSRDAVTSENVNPLASRRSRRSTDSSSSTPPAPPPTMTTCLNRPLATRARSASKRAMKPSIGLTGIACSAAPGTSPMLGREPMSSESRSYGNGGRLRQSTRRFARSRPTASSWYNRAPANRASRPVSMCASSIV